MIGKRMLAIVLILASSLFIFCSKTTTVKSGNYSYETVKGDPLKARIYTLDNGLKVYLTVYKDAPRIQTCIPVRVGGKNDPPETTGLAHYLEHLLFKGTDEFGSTFFQCCRPAGKDNIVDPPGAVNMVCLALFEMLAVETIGHEVGQHGA